MRSTFSIARIISFPPPFSPLFPFFFSAPSFIIPPCPARNRKAQLGRTLEDSGQALSFFFFTALKQQDFFPPLSLGPQEKASRSYLR